MVLTHSQFLLFVGLLWMASTAVGGRAKIRRYDGNAPDSSRPSFNPRYAPASEDTSAERSPTSLPHFPFQYRLKICTPLLGEDFYDSRFSTLGIHHLISFPVAGVGRRSYLAVESGLGINFSKLVLANVNTELTHLFFIVPLRLALYYQMNRMRLGIALGGEIKLFEYDSRDTDDGGFFVTRNLVNYIYPDVQIHLALNLSSNIAVFFEVGYLYLGGGLSFHL